MITGWGWAIILIGVGVGGLFIAGWWKYRKAPADQREPLPYPNRQRSPLARHPRLSLIVGVAYVGVAILFALAALHAH